MKRRTTKTTLVNRLMNEHVTMLGMPHVIVTREFCFSWLKANGGFDPKAKGFASLDYAVFGRKAVDAPLTDEAKRDRLLAMMAESMKEAA